MYKLYKPDTNQRSVSFDANNLAITKYTLDFIKENYPELCPLQCIDMKTGEIVYKI